VRRGHANVDDGESGLQRSGHRQKLGRVTRLRRDLEPAPFEEAGEAFSQENIVVCQHGARLLVVRTLVRVRAGR
jgi:hypothetical protein